MCGIAVYDLRLKIIRPTLEYLNLWSVSAENLLLGTAAVESMMGRYLTQLNGPALGMYQTEPETHQDILQNYLFSRKELNDKVLGLASHKNIYTNRNEDLIYNMAYSTAIARIFYLRIPEALPAADDIEGLANYWKQHYNTEKGKGTIEQFVRNYKELVLGIKE